MARRMLVLFALWCCFGLVNSYAQQQNQQHVLTGESQTGKPSHKSAELIRNKCAVQKDALKIELRADRTHS